MTINLKIPRSWNELSPLQVQNICLTLHYNQVLVKKNFTPEYVNQVSFFSIAKELLRGNGFKAIWYALHEIRVKAFRDYVNFIFDKDVALHNFPETLQTDKELLYGPHFRLKNCTIGEFSFADALFYRWKNTQDERYLNLFVAALYRPKKKKHDIIDRRVPFNKIVADHYFNAVAQVPLAQKLPIAYAFEGSRNYLVSQYPNVFPKPKKEKEATQNTTKGKQQPYITFGRLISAKIEYDQSKLELVENNNVYKFFSVYELELEELKKVKQRNPKTKTR